MVKGLSTAPLPKRRAATQPGKAEHMIGVTVRDRQDRRREHVGAERELQAFAGVDEQLQRPVPEPVGVHAPAETPHRLAHLTLLSVLSSTPEFASVLELQRIVGVRFFYVSQVRAKPMSSAMTTARFPLATPPDVRFLFADGARLDRRCGGNGGRGGPGGGRRAAPRRRCRWRSSRSPRSRSSRPASTSPRSSRGARRTIQPQVEGFLTRIAVRSGEHVRAGRGAVRDRLGAAAGGARVARNRCAPMRESDVEFARQQVAAQQDAATPPARSASARSSRSRRSCAPAEAQLKALDEQIRQQRSRAGLLPRHRRRPPAPSATSRSRRAIASRDTTVLTTVDENDVLEIYVNVPVQQAPQLKVGLPVRIVDDRGQVLATNKITFVSPSVEPDADGAGEGALVGGPRPVPLRSVRARARGVARRRRASPCR